MGKFRPITLSLQYIQFEGSIEPTYEDLVLVIKAIGFEIIVSLHSSI